MAATVKGLAVAWGITTTGYAYTGSATALNVKDIEQTLTKDAEVVESRDADGDVNGLVFFNPTTELSLRVYPSAVSATNTLANAKTQAATLPAIGDKFTITDADDASIAGTDWVVMRVGKTRSITNRVEFDITVKKWSNDVSATISS